ncbi:hypothetical protein LTR91_024660 [Friedmanniomyces endolithicus]|uniref:Uncharacterized protein n=1 Tax=Friedmanniomyces endolithicus TaxID=329885 RepID=A0AAN6H0M4_9PEZI|nr:hypothetical protein LTS02_005021 [Friedmanniomyces endolithicus]KAK0928229.1 hypothetical protein LTR57_002963 [Friedmanniomyces endolithicus]KAK0952005.1 hypothetical protein LTR91_024660 [Friedmanniomyces endolithicus]KAK0952688.1 hypothetical protein LTS01_024720 [Friedmanniomyces endolithicus]KAK1022216.1 hypothetical protein LTS16_025898 [Friedmanniomyces endolithicus]
MPTDIDCVGGLHSHDGAPSASPKTLPPEFTLADTSASTAAFHSAGIMDALSAFTAAFGDETHDTQELVYGWRTAASESDGAFWHDIPPDDFAAAHGPVSNATSASHAHVQDERKIEPRMGGALDRQPPRSAGEETDDRGSICPASRHSLDVERLGGLLVAGSGPRPESAQYICHGNETPSAAPSCPQSIAAAIADGLVTEDFFGGLNDESNAPVMQSSNSLKLANDAASLGLEHGGLLAESKGFQSLVLDSCYSTTIRLHVACPPDHFRFALELTLMI